jgi:tRNA A37 threonylcarbamoyladenosine dehydratase
MGCEALARTGIGAITLIDMDDVCVTNTNRQIHALRDNVGLAKAEVMAQRISLINPECRVTVIDDFVTADNVAQYMAAGYSYVIDAIDSVRPKAALIAWCRRNKIPLVTTGGAGGQIDPTQIQVADLAKPFRIRWRQNCVSASKAILAWSKTAKANWAWIVFFPPKRWFTRRQMAQCAR